MSYGSLANSYIKHMRHANEILQLRIAYESIQALVYHMFDQNIVGYNMVKHL